MMWLWQLLAFGLGVSLALVTYRIWRRQGSPQHWVRRAVVVGAALLAALLLHGAWHGVQAERAAAAWHTAARDRGAQIFQERGCSNCHSVGGGVVVGPDLRRAPAKYDHETLVHFIESPESVYAARHKRPLNEGFSEMPELGVADSEAEAIAEYLQAPGELRP